ncbi:hypothetical protein EX30DRAFT_333891 [Ascodesmis nigricans]|uniref:UBX domain-containing protein n=1 Tax=Ascodesmis nigricans TaxID=341454 RepID=A0A4S2MPF3_9PEZI|nr:hypothetical protein EX30DRAFT_333891 [Ascodesmis nigricans]
MASHEELIDQFVAITDATASKADTYLRVSDWDLERAIQLFFETGGAMDAPPAESSRPGASASNAQVIDDDDLGQALRASGGAGVYEDDEAMARRLQEEFYGATGGAGGGDEVRAPIPRTRETLVGGYDEEEYEYQEPPRRRTTAGRAGIFNQQNPVWDDPDEDGISPEERRRRRLAAATGGESERSARDRSLAELFSPPFDIISNLEWDDAREEAKEVEKWILVNVQDNSIFQSQVLNRDIWKHPEVKTTITANFIFLQLNRAGRDARDYIRLYIPDAASPEAAYNGSEALFPHIAIIDPRTGEQVKVWSKPPSSPIEFVHDLHEFLDRYSLSVDAKNPVQRKPKPKKIDVDSMTEEEMMRIAMEESLGAASSSTSNVVPHDPDAYTREDTNMMDIEPPAPPHRSPSPEPAPVQNTPWARISSTNHHTEPPPGPATTRIQFKLSDGSRVIRRFGLQETVEQVFEYVKADLLPEEARKKGDEGILEREVELVSLGKKLVEYLEQTVEQAGLKQGTVMVDFLD